jgi:hypothetical protein
MTVATAFAVSWKPLTNSNPSAISSATPSRKKGSSARRCGIAPLISLTRL